MSSNLPAEHLKALSSELRDASDAKILKVTQMIDLLPERGNADLLIAPVRSRLAKLQPARPLIWLRLLFTPLDPVLVSGAAWRAEDLAIPRSLLRPLASLLLDSSFDAMTTLPASISRDEASLTRAGAPLWRAAAARLADITLPESWSEAGWQKRHGLTAATIGPLLPAIRLILEHAVTLRTLPPHDSAGSEPVIGALLADAAEAGPVGWGIMLTLLLEGEAPDQVARIAAGVVRGSRFSAALQQGLARATAETLDRTEALIMMPLPADGADNATLDARLALTGRIEGLRRLELRSADEQRQVSRLRQTLAAANRLLFGQTLRARLPGLASGTGAVESAAPASDAVVQALEAEARRLRSFALVAARLGDAKEYESLLEHAALRYAATRAAPGPGRADQLRLVELLLGSERAMQFMAA